ncbi:MAG: methyltransferase family protein [Bryobacteraceae bacterium]
MIHGFYCYVRNPMYLAVVSIVAGQGIWFGSTGLLAYGAVVWLGFHGFVIAYEEPTLRRKYGAEYEAFCSRVHRWLPRI